VYVGQTVRANEVRCQEHITHLRHGQSDKSAVSALVLNVGHEIQLKKTHRLTGSTINMVHIVKEATRIQLQSRYFNRGARFVLSSNMGADNQ
jgi:hypothetical protein